MTRTVSPEMAAARAMVRAGMAPREAAARCAVPLGPLKTWASREGLTKDRTISRARHAAAMKRAMADPEVRARHAAAMADPEVRARHAAAMKRKNARAIVKACGLPLMRATVDRARDLLDAGHDMETAADALLQEALEARRGGQIEARA